MSVLRVTTVTSLAWRDISLDRASDVLPWRRETEQVAIAILKKTLAMTQTDNFALKRRTPVTEITPCFIATTVRYYKDVEAYILEDIEVQYNCYVTIKT